MHSLAEVKLKNKKVSNRELFNEKKSSHQLILEKISNCGLIYEKKLPPRLPSSHVH
jgi:hypothetical protein